MKSKITTLLLSAVFLTTSIFASNIGGNVNSQVLSAFTSKFTEAKHISWSKSDNYVKASFQMNGQHMFAYYAETGELMGVSRHLTSSQLPINLQSEVKRISPDSWITELFEYATESETTYYMTIENAEQKIHLKSESAHSFVVFRKTKKA